MSLKFIFFKQNVFVSSFAEDESNENEQHEITMEKKKENDRGECEMIFISPGSKFNCNFVVPFSFTLFWMKTVFTDSPYLFQKK